VLDKSSLIELLMELRKSGKTIFIALIHRLHDIKWFSEQFFSLAARDEASTQPFTFFDTLDLENEIEIPCIDYQLTKPRTAMDVGSVPVVHEIAVHSPAAAPVGSRSFRRHPTFVGVSTARAPTREELMRLASARGLTYLLENLKLSTERPPGSIFFNVHAACDALGIRRFDAKNVSFDDTILPAEAFFGYLKENLQEPLLVEEARIARVLVLKFTTLCTRKEAHMVNLVFDLKDTLLKRAYAKCTHEMEVFSAWFRMIKAGKTLDDEPFEYDIGSAGLVLQHLIARLFEIDIPIFVQSFVTIDTVSAVAKEAVKREIEFSSDT
jgi:hypothetical protein